MGNASISADASVGTMALCHSFSSEDPSNLLVSEVESRLMMTMKLIYRGCMAAIALALVCSPEGSSQDSHVAILRYRYIILNAAVTSKHVRPASSLQQSRRLPLSKQAC